MVFSLSWTGADGDGMVKFNTPSGQHPPPDNLDILRKKKHDIVVTGKAGLEVRYDEVSRLEGEGTRSQNWC